jgi:hypothetical protein
VGAGVSEEAQRAVHAALKDYLDEGEIAISWCLTVDVVGPDNTRYLIHRAGGGVDGTDAPMAWTALGMLETSADTARDQLREMTVEPDEDDED